MQQSIPPWCLFNTIIKEVGNTNIALEHLPLEATSKKLGEKEVQFNYFDGSYIWDFGNAQY